MQSPQQKLTKSNDNSNWVRSGVLSQGKAKPPTMTINSYATKKA